MAQIKPQRHLLSVFSTFAVGGQQTRFVSLANALSDKYRHTVLAMDGNYEAASGLDARVDCAFENMSVVKSRGLSLANLRTARALLNRLRPGLLCTYNWGSIEWAVANWFSPVCPQIHIEDGFGPDESPDHQHWRRATMRRLCLSRCAHVVVPSRVLYNIAVEKWGLPSRRVLYMPNGIDCERFARAAEAELLASLGITDEHLVVGTVAALRREKNLDRLLRVFAALPSNLPTRLVIVGDGPERGALAQTAEQLGIAGRVIFTGALAAPERILGRFDVFALSSDTEQMPNSVLEAMAAGLPVLATDVGDVKQMVVAENAPFVIAREDTGALSEGLAALLQDRAMRTGIGNRNRSRVRAEYSLAQMVLHYDALFEAAGKFRAD